LTRLAESLELNFSGQLGKQSSKLISKMISAKMPAGFNHSVIRDYLEHTWGLGPSRQAAVFLLAMTEEPKARLTSVQSAKSYIDSQVSRYAASSGLVLQAVHENLTSIGPTAMVDSSQIKALQKEQNKLHLKQLGVLADHLKMDPFEDLKTIESQARLDLRHSEFSADFETGITPVSGWGEILSFF
jgi:fatty acid synthase subunit alpha, fungi type